MSGTEQQPAAAAARTVVAEELARSCLCQCMSAERVQRLAAIARLEQAPAGTVLLREGEPARDVFVIVKGRVALSIEVSGRGETVVATLSTGEMLGWSALLSDRKWVATARTLKPTTLLVLAGKALAELCERDLELGYRVMRNAFAAVADRLRDTRVQLLDVFQAHE